LYKITGVKEELITDADMYMFFEEEIRGGISCIPGKYAKANNKNIPDYNPNEVVSYIRYLDANNLYGFAMSQPLPLCNFKWRYYIQITHEIFDLLTNFNYAINFYLYIISGKHIRKELMRLRFSFHLPTIIINHHSQRSSYFSSSSNHSKSNQQNESKTILNRCGTNSSV